MVKTVRDRKRRETYKVTNRYGKFLVNNGDATYLKEQKVKPATKEQKPKAKVITKAVK